MVHGGFQRAYDAVHTRVLALVEELTSEGDVPWTVYVTGHSLGGALATCSAYELATKQCVGAGMYLDVIGCVRTCMYHHTLSHTTHHHHHTTTITRWKHDKPPKIIMYNFGSPRVGNIVFAKSYNTLVPDSWRIANSKDIVASVPRLMGYCHAGNCLQLGEDGIADVQPIDQYGRRVACRVFVGVLGGCWCAGWLLVVLLADGMWAHWPCMCMDSNVCMHNNMCMHNNV